jgi:hypothetical protein
MGSAYSPATATSYDQSAFAFLQNVLVTYHAHFWLFLKFVVPAAIFGYCAMAFLGGKAQDIVSSLPHGPERIRHSAELLAAFFLRFGGFIVSWVLYCFAFAGTCVAVSETERGVVPAPEQALQAVRDRFLPFLRISLVLFLLLILAMVLAIISGVILLGAASKFGWRLSGYGWQIGLSVIALPFLLALSRFGLAMPAVVLDHRGVSESLFLADTLASGKLARLLALLVESVGGSYVAAVGPFWLAGWLLHGRGLPAWGPWALWIVAWVGGVLVQPTLFIGLALLYIRSTHPLPGTAPAT